MLLEWFWSYFWPRMVLQMSQEFPTSSLDIELEYFLLSFTESVVLFLGICKRVYHMTLSCFFLKSSHNLVWKCVYILFSLLLLFFVLNVIVFICGGGATHTYYTPKGRPGMSDLSFLSGISGLSFDSPFLSPVLLFLLCPLALSVLSFSANGPFSWLFSRKLSNIFC